MEILPVISKFSQTHHKRSHTAPHKRNASTPQKPNSSSSPSLSFFLTRRSVKINSSRRYRRVLWKSNPKIYRRQFRRRSARFADCQTHQGFRQRLPVSTVLLLATALIKNSDKDTHLLTCLYRFCKTQTCSWINLSMSTSFNGALRFEEA